MRQELFIKNLISRMTLEEKVRQMQMLDDFNALLENGAFSEKKADEILKGVSIGCVQIFQLEDLEPENLRTVIRDFQKYLRKKTRHGIPALVVAESLHGVMSKGTTVFPQSIGLSCSWNRDLVEKIAESIEEEAEHLGVSQVLAPDLDLARDPRWGRVEETYGEDPYLVGELGACYVKGIQKRKKIAATLKHFAAHGTPESGINLSPVSTGERQLRELFLPPFEKAMREKPLSLMPAYSEFDGVPCSSSKKLLTDILRDEMGFDGYVISDYMAIEMLHNFHCVAETPKEAGRQALLAGIDLEAPNEYGFGKNTLQLIKEGKLREEDLERAVERILSVKLQLGLFEDCKEEENFEWKGEKQRKLALEAAEESIVLLKNKGILPFDPEVKSIAVIGPNANVAQLGDYTLARDGVTLLDGLKEIYKGEIYYSKGSTIYQRIPEELDKAMEAAERSEVVLLVLGGSSMSIGGVGWGSEEGKEITCGEGFDSVDIRLPEAQIELAERILKLGKPTVLILEDGRPCAIPEIYDQADAILQAWYPGHEGGRALTNILFGKINPSAKLTVNIPKHVGQIPMFYNHKPSARGFYHKPGSLEQPGRDYTQMDTRPYYEFGYGLSYTKFSYTNLEIEVKKRTVRISVDVENIGSVPGKEIVQLYVNDLVSSTTTPVKALKGFCKIGLNSGEKQKVSFEIGAEELYVIDKNMQKVVEEGWFEVYIGELTGKFFMHKIEL